MLVGESCVALACRLFAFGRPLAGIGDGQRRSHHQDLAHARLGFGSQDHPPQPWVDGQTCQAPTEVGDLAVLVERPEFLQQLHAIADTAPVRGVQERKLLHVAQFQRCHLQQHRGKIRPQDLGISEARTTRVVIFGVQPNAHTGRNATAPAGPLRSRGLRDRLYRQALNFQAAAVTRDAGIAGVDDVPDAGDCQRCLGDIGRQHDTAPAMRSEHLVLFRRRQTGVQRQYLGILEVAQSICGITDFAFTRQKHQHVTRRLGLQFMDGVDDRLDFVADLGAHYLVVRVVWIVVSGCGHRDFERAIPDLDWMGPTGHLDDRCATEVCREALRLNGCRRDDHFELRAAGQQLMEVSEQEVDVQAAFMGFIDDEGVVAHQPAIALDLGQQNAIGHQFDQGALADVIVESHRIAHGIAERSAQFVSDTLGDRAGGKPPGLRVADHGAHTAAHFEADFR